MINTSGRRRRWAAAAAVVALGGVSLAACSSSGGGSASGQEPQTITFAYSNPSGNEHYYQDAAKAYEKLHPGVTITLQSLPAESYAQAITTRVEGGNAPDVFQAESGSGQTDSIQGFAKAGLLLPLTDPQLKQDLAPAGLAQFQYKGTIYAVSLGSSVNGIVYNDQAAKATGITLTASSTFSDIMQACATAKAKGKALFALAGAAPPNTGILALIIATSAVYGPDPGWDAQRTAGTVKFATTPSWTATLNSIVQMNKAGCYQPGAQSAGFDAITNSSSRGLVFGFFAPGGAAHDIYVASGGHVSLVVLPFPGLSGTTYASLSSDIAITGSAHTKSPKLVASFLGFLASPAGQKVLAADSGYFPVGTTNVSTLPAQYKPVASMITSQQTRNFPTVNWPNGKVYADLGSGVQGLLTGQQTTQQVLQQMDSDWDAP
ncbi:MAG TPA: extracellular solute-binding protein [Streptosporangiaceae bacterium]|nr:extracellular solute-binding protein [Streptosporangiaceae bacterium]